MYKPLIESLTIKESSINGLGLFADQDIIQGTNLGMSHVLIGSGIIRTPMGGFINHANEPNTVKVELKINGDDDDLQYMFNDLSRDIKDLKGIQHQHQHQFYE